MEIKLKKITIREVCEGYRNDAEEGVVGYHGKLNIRPAYQREFVYKDKKRDEVIRSIMRGLPLNVFYWCKTGEDTYVVIKKACGVHTPLIFIIVRLCVHHDLYGVGSSQKLYASNRANMRSYTECRSMFIGSLMPTDDGCIEMTMFPLVVKAKDVSFTIFYHRLCKPRNFSNFIKASYRYFF
jgi:hypothetical protein